MWPSFALECKQEGIGWAFSQCIFGSRLVGIFGCWQSVFLLGDAALVASGTAGTTLQKLRI